MAPEFESDPYQSYPTGSIIPIYAEKALRKKDARIYELTQGEDLGGADIQIPLRGLYSITGTVVAQGNQAPIVFGSVSLRDSNDNTLNRRTWVNADGSFQFAYVPPGKYELKTMRLSDRPPYSPGQLQRGSGHTYADVTITVLVIDKNLDGVAITVPDTAKPVRR